MCAFQTVVGVKVSSVQYHNVDFFVFVFVAKRGKKMANSKQVYLTAILNWMLQKCQRFETFCSLKSHRCYLKNPVVQSIRWLSLVAWVCVCWIWLEAVAVEFRVVLFWPCSLTSPSKWHTHTQHTCTRTKWALWTRGLGNNNNKDFKKMPSDKSITQTSKLS